MKKIVFFLLVTSVQLSFSQAGRKYSNEFLNIGVDAAALGMSKSVTASSGDVNSIYWNPAGLTKVNVNQGALMHTNHFAGIGNYDYAAVALAPKEKDGTVIAFSLIRFGVDDILNTTALLDSQGNIDYTKISRFSAADYAFNFGVAKKIKKIKNLSFGFNAKVVRRIIGSFASSWGFGLDAGFQYEAKNWQFGLMVRDVTTTFNLWEINTNKLTTGIDEIDNLNSELPETIEITIPKIHLGVARNFTLKNKDFNLLTELNFNIRLTQTNDIVSTSFASMSPALGLQLDFKKFIFLRGGLGNFQKEHTFDSTSNLIDGSDITMQPNVGIGFRYHGIQIDYAMSNIASTGNALYSNSFSLKIDFDFLKKRN